MRVAVVGHVEWVEFARVEQIPRPGEIVHALETWEEPAGGGAVAAAQLARLAGSCLFFTSLGADELGRRSRADLTRHGIDLRSIPEAEPTRRAFTYVDETGERTITVLGEKLRPRGGDSRLPWRELAGLDAVYFVSGDAESLHHARLARILVATARASSSTRSSEAGRTKASSTTRASSTRRLTWSSRPPAGLAAGSSRAVLFGQRPCLAPSSMPTAAGTASPPA
jgi:ribokinase